MKIISDILSKNVYRHYHIGKLGCRPYTRQFKILERIIFPVFRDMQQLDGFECLVPSPFLKQSANI